MIMEDQDLGTKKRPVGRPSYGSKLSPAEQKVFDQMLLGLTNAEAAALLGLKTKTIKFHVRNILRKKCASSRFRLLANELQTVIAKRAVKAMETGEPCGVVLSFYGGGVR